MRNINWQVCSFSVQSTIKYPQLHLRQVPKSSFLSGVDGGCAQLILGSHTQPHVDTLSDIRSAEEIRLSHFGPMWSSTAYLRSANPQLSVSQKCLGLVLFEKLGTQMFPTCGCRAAATDPNLFQQAYTQS